MRPANKIWATAVEAVMSTLPGIMASADPGGTTPISVSDAGVQGKTPSVGCRYPRYKDVFVHHVRANFFADGESHLFEDDIHAIAEPGITHGCNPPHTDRYCPDDLLIRGQAAAFMRKALLP